VTGDRSISGLELSRAFYEEVGRPIIARDIPSDKYAAALTGPGSEVLGFDDHHSRDHNWGPRFTIFVSEEVDDRTVGRLDARLRVELPPTFRDWSTHFGKPDKGGTRFMEARAEGPVDHAIALERLPTYLQNWLGIPPGAELTPALWMQMPEHNLLGFTSGEVFHDGVGDLTAWRQRLRSYPEAVVLLRLHRLWQAIAAEESFVGRCDALGDTLGTLLIIGRIIDHLIRLCFLYEGRYAPYSKWFGAALERLSCGPDLSPSLQRALQGRSMGEREEALAQAYRDVAGLHNRSAWTAPVPVEISPRYEGRPGLCVHADRFVEAIGSRLTQPPRPDSG
jgi:hypothetical protein